MIVGTSVATALGTLWRNDAQRPNGAQLGFEVVAITVIPLALCPRRRFVFLARAFVWTVSPLLSSLDGNLIPTQRGVFVTGLGAAVLLGCLKLGGSPGSGWRWCL